MHTQTKIAPLTITKVESGEGAGLRWKNRTAMEKHRQSLMAIISSTAGVCTYNIKGISHIKSVVRAFNNIIRSHF